jgi:hypothetical protein
LRDASQQQIRVIDCRRCVSLAFLAVITSRPSLAAASFAAARITLSSRWMVVAY